MVKRHLASGVLGTGLLTGRRPWAGESLVRRHLQAEARGPGARNVAKPTRAGEPVVRDRRRAGEGQGASVQTIDEFLDQLTYNPPPLLADVSAGFREG